MLLTFSEQHTGQTESQEVSEEGSGAWPMSALFSLHISLQTEQGRHPCSAFWFATEPYYLGVQEARALCAAAQNTFRHPSSRY